MTPSQDLFQKYNKEKDKKTTKRLSKHECYSAIKTDNIKLWIWNIYHMSV